ncbi:helix-turn-helix domain-containing protein [Oceanobacillus timonensis]|uniref:helix-turn-helix domain-containing protein n=1 Tax=Oceanobacillus timonensis TaxID=1926285 RepID=UPI001C4DE015|nr:helix-turn-helix transcriptional regulator [Oceanobacillus timonensis]
MSDERSLNHLKAFRKIHKLSQKDIADKVGVSVSFYSKIEGGFKYPSYQFLKKLKETFGDEVDMNDFF